MGTEIEIKRATWMHRLPSERQTQVLGQLDRDSSPGFDFFLLVVLSCAIATFGLVTDSAAVIIGAMLVAPLMSPILGLSLAVVTLAEGAHLQILTRRATFGGVEWVEIRDLLSRSGWVMARYLKITP